MKTLLLSLLLLLFSFAAVAQQVGTPDRSTAGIGLRVMPYNAVGAPDYQLRTLEVPFILLHYSYSIGDRATMQFGLGYGMNEAQTPATSWRITPDSVYMKAAHYRLRAVISPVTLKYNVIRTNKRLQVQAYASLTPIYRSMKIRETETLYGSSTLIAEPRYETISSFTAVASAGITLQYKLNDRWSAYAEGDLIYHSFERQHPTVSLINGTKGIGLNYNLNLRREK